MLPPKRCWSALPRGGVRPWTRIGPVASIASGVLLLLVAGAASAHVPPLLVQYLPGVELDAGDLSADQSAALNAIRDDPAAIDIRIGEANQDTVREDLALSLVLPAPPEGDLETIASFHDLILEERVPQDYSLYFRDDAAGSEVALVIAGPDVLGTIHYSGALYKVHPLGDGFTAVYRYDTSRLPRRGRGRESVSETQPRLGAAAPKTRAKSEGDVPVIDIMVAYTRRARIKSGNINALLRYTFDQTNRIYANSQIRPRVRLVHSYQTKYAQEEQMLQDLTRLQSPADSYMDEVHSQRNEYAADVVVLLVAERSDRCSIAYIYPGDEYAFSVIAQSCIGLYQLANNLGTVLGARRNPESRMNDYFAYGHGFCNDADNWRTVMAWNQNDRCPVPIPYFSNPEVSYRGTPTGDAELRNNARVINETAGRIAGFRDPPPPARAFLIPLIMSADNSTQQGFVRITNRSYRAGTVEIHAVDDEGQRFGPISLSLDRRASAHFNSKDLEEGNSEKGLSAGVGDGDGNWRLELDTALDIEPRAYVRTLDGFLTSIHEVAGSAGGGSMRYQVPIFNPASNRYQTSRLRLVNLGEDAARIRITGRDDRGDEAPEGDVTLTLGAGKALMLSAQELEKGGEDLTGRLGDGTGKWQLLVSATRPVVVMSLLQSPTGNLTNLSP